MHGHNLVDMQSDYEELVNVCVKRNIRPIITTLAPLANTSQYYLRDMRDKLVLFNNYLRDHYYPRYRVINLWSKLVTPRGRTRFEYFESYVIYLKRLNEFSLMTTHLAINQIVLFLCFLIFKGIDLRYRKQSTACFVEPIG